MCLWALGSGGLALGCGSGESTCTSIACASPTPAGGSSAGGSSAGPGAGAGNSSPGDSTFGNADVSQDTTLGEGEACRQVDLKSQASPVNVHILLDRSISMRDPVVAGDTSSPSRWDAVTAALRAFVSSPQVSQTSVGLQFFGLINGEDDCGVDKYRTPAVAIAPIEQNRAELIGAIDAQQPGSLTPTPPALEGALQYAAEVARSAAGQGRPTVLILASDGQPSECGPVGPDGERTISFAQLEETLASFAEPPLGEDGEPSAPPILTYVIGTEELRFNAAALASAGGGQAFLVGSSTSGSFEDEFLDALLRIVVKPLDCRLDIPQEAPDTGERIDFDRVRVRYSAATGSQPVEFPRTENIATCGRERAWYYDDPEAPRSIIFCGQACASLGAGDLSVELGCAPERIVL